MERADAGERVVGMARHGQVSHLGMTEPVEDLAIDHRAAADPGPERQVDEGLEAPCRPPATLRQRRGVDVRVEADRDAEGRRERADQRRIRPARLGRRRDRSVLGVARPQLDRPERADPDRVEPPALGDGAPEEVDRRGEGLVRARRGKAQRLDDLARSGADDAHELGPAGLYAAEHPALSTPVAAKHRLQSRSITATPAHGGPTGGPPRRGPAGVPSGAAAVGTDQSRAGLTTVGWIASGSPGSGPSPSDGPSWVGGG